jgi:hypothetical protein
MTHVEYAMPCLADQQLWIKPRSVCVLLTRYSQRIARDRRGFRPWPCLRAEASRLGRRPHDARHTAATVFARRRHRIDRHADRAGSPRTGCRDGDPTPRVGSSTSALPVWGSLLRARRMRDSNPRVNPTRFPSLMTVDRSRPWLTAVQVEPDLGEPSTARDCHPAAPELLPAMSGRDRRQPSPPAVN